MLEAKAWYFCVITEKTATFGQNRYIVTHSVNINGWESTLRELSRKQIEIAGFTDLTHKWKG